MRGVPGTVDGVTTLLAVDSALVPTAFTARTWNRYAVPFVNVVIVALVGASAVPGGSGIATSRTKAFVALLVTRITYCVIVDPPLMGAVHDSCALPTAPRATGAAGVFGVVTGVTVLDASDSGPVPCVLKASTLK